MPLNAALSMQPLSPQWFDAVADSADEAAAMLSAHRHDFASANTTQASHAMGE